MFLGLGFCPRCGGTIWSQLYGGDCGKICVYCQKAMYCSDATTGKMLKDSLPVKNPFKAIMLRMCYNAIPGNRKSGKLRLKNHQEHVKESKEFVRRYNESKKRLEQALEGAKPLRYEVYEGSIEEFFEKRKQKK